MDNILSKLHALKRRERIYGIRNPLTYDFLHHNLHHLHVLLFHSADQQDFTRGAIVRQLLIFMLPILLSQLLQQFYTIADTALVGQVLGAEALAAVGTSSLVLSVMVNFFIGFSAGLSVLVSHLYGEKQYDRLSALVQSIFVTVIAFAVLFTAAGILLTEHLLTALSTPAELIPQASLYLRIALGGMLAQLLYNTASAILRALGNTTSALHYLAVAVVLMNLDKVGPTFSLIVENAFGLRETLGGLAGSMSAAMMNGVRRGLFSNEAGEGSIPNAAATANVTHPVKQGLVQAFGVYVDTWIVCSATAFIVLLTGQYTIGGDTTGIALAQDSLASVFGPLASSLLAVLIFLFAFSSVVGNYYYGEINIHFITENTKPALFAYRLAVVAMVFFGCVAAFGLVWNLADLFMAMICLTNLYAIARLAPLARIALADYFAQKAAGKNPVFDPSIMPDQHGIMGWDEAQFHAQKH